MAQMTQQEIDQLALNYINAAALIPNSSFKEKKELKKIQNECIKKLGFLVTSKLYKYKKFSNYEDLQQEGYEALLMALATFKDQKSSFSWWGTKYIATRISRAANKHSTIKVPIKHAAEQKPLKATEIPVIEDSTTPDKDLIFKEIYSEISTEIDKLKYKDKQIAQMFYGVDGITQHTITTISEELKISRSSVAKTVSNLQKKFRSIIEQ